MKGEDGVCHGWAEFFKDTLRTQGVITAARRRIDTPPETNPASPAEWLLIRNMWINLTNQTFGGLDLNLAGLPGQGVAINPSVKIFNAHAVVIIVDSNQSSIIFDPSYGKVYADLASWENVALAGIWYKVPDSVSIKIVGDPTTIGFNNMKTKLWNP